LLRFLAIRDFVLVEQAELAFGPGFSALTGETGAGKSVLIDALALALGERADAAQVRAGAARAEVSAEFDIARLPAVAAWLEAGEMNGDPGVCLLRRVVDAGGRSRAFINGVAATAQQLREVGDLLVDIHGQHAHQSLLRAETQRRLLDALGGLEASADEVAAAWRAWQALKAQRLERSRNAEAMERERDQVAFVVRELEALAVSADEWRELQSEHARLTHGAALIEAAQFALEALEGAEDSVLSRLNAAAQRLRALADVDPALKELTELMDPAAIQLQEAVYGLNRYVNRVELDPARLAEVEQRLAAVHGAARKHRVPPEELPDVLARAQARLAEIGDSADIDALLARERTAQEAWLRQARQLSAGREKAARELSAAVTRGLQDLAMGGGVFAAALTPLPEGGSHGLEQVEFQVAAHAGLPLRPLAKVASGGELSRISLAIQVITSTVASVPTLIFDEVDAGIGGKVAEIVGRLLRELGRAYQVMCVTHLPQVAAAADHQWQVAKEAGPGGVVTRIRPLPAAERVEEIARMLGGVTLTDTTRRHAAEMLGLAKGARSRA
jgi:DNA repair protein RecN (Recombination protein N)